MDKFNIQPQKLMSAVLVDSSLSLSSASPTESTPSKSFELMECDPLKLTPSETAFVDSKVINKAEISRIFAVPKIHHWVSIRYRMARITKLAPRIKITRLKK